MKFLLASLILFGTFSKSLGQEDSLITTSARLICEVEFIYYEGDGKAPPEKAVKYVVKLINLSDTPIPDLDVTNRRNRLQLHVNQDTASKWLINHGFETAGSDHLLAKGDTSTWDLWWILYKDSKYWYTYGNEFEVQWEYRGLKSNVVKVNLKERTAIELSGRRELYKLIEVADKKMDNKEYDRAHELYSRAIKFDPNNTYVQEKLTALEVLIAAQNFEKEYQLLKAKARSYFDSGDYAQAKVLYARLRELKPTDTEVDDLLNECIKKLPNDE